MIGGVGSVRGLTVMIATEGIFVWCAVAPASACKHCQKYLCTVSTLPTRRFKNVESPEKSKNRAFSVIKNPLKVNIQLSRATYDKSTAPTESVSGWGGLCDRGEENK
jgi:hypothetical protein